MRSWLYILIILVPGILNAQEFKIKFVDDSEAELGTSVAVELRFTFDPEEAPPEFPSFEEGEQLTDILEISSVDDKKYESKGNSGDMIQTIHLVCWDTGYHAIEPFGAEYNGDSIFSNALMLYVPSIEVDVSKGPKDIKDIYEEEWTGWDKFVHFLNENKMIIFTIIIALISFILTYLYFRRWRHKKEQAIQNIPAHELAFMRLNELESKNLWKTGKLKLYYIELTDILRRYIEQRFMVPAMEQITEEILENLRFSDLEAEEKRKLREVLKLSDMVKFAKEQPGPKENDNALLTARDFVKRTLQVDESDE